MSKSSNSLSWNTVLIVLAAAFLSSQTLRSCKGDDSEDTKPKAAGKTADLGDDISITKKMMSGSEKDVLVVRTHDQQYVRIDDMVFCWRGSNLIGVFNKDGLVPGWQTFTNQPPPTK